MTKTGKITPGVLAIAFKENMNAKGTLKAQFKSHFLSKFSNEQLKGISDAASAELNGRTQAVVDEKIKFLSDLGYKVSKK